MLLTYSVEVRITLRRVYHVIQETRGLARQDAIKRAMRDFNVPRDAVDATVLDEVESGEGDRP